MLECPICRCINPKERNTVYVMLKDLPECPICYHDIDVPLKPFVCGHCVCEVCYNHMLLRMHQVVANPSSPPPPQVSAKTSSPPPPQVSAKASLPPPPPPQVSAKASLPPPPPPPPVAPNYVNVYTQTPHQPFVFEGRLMVWVLYAYTFTDWTLFDATLNTVWQGYSVPPAPTPALEGKVFWVRKSKRWACTAHV
jgi:hypothetical protein